MSSPPAAAAQPVMSSPTASPNTTSSTPQYDAPTGPPPPQPAPTDPKVAELLIMFPSVDVGVIEMILESVGGSQDRAIETLLSMTDPEFKPDDRHVRTEEESQYDLDAQFARSLAMQDEQDANERRGQSGLPYQPRVRRSRPQQGNDQFSQDRQSGYQGGQQGQYGSQSQYGHQQGAQNPPGMIAVEEKLTQFAEVGKQTFNSLFSRAKAKYNEFQTQHAATNAQPDRARESQWGNTRDEPWRHPSPAGTPTPGGGRGGDQNRRSPWGDDASSFSSQSTDPGPTPLSPHSAANPPIRQSAARWQPSDAYDDPSPPIRTGSVTRLEVGGRRSPAVGSPGVGSPDKGGASVGKIDPAKLGILPKKRVDLLSSSPPTVTSNRSTVVEADDDDDTDPNPSLPPAHKSLVEQIPKTPPAKKESFSKNDSDDDLEYTRNPFDEK